jgi:peptidoglycan/LPS O-acetylase OafA/YrhL
MARDQSGGSFLALLVANTAAAAAALSLNGFLLQGLTRGGWDYRRAVIITLPYALIWGFVGGGIAFILCRRVRPRLVSSRVLLSSATGAALAAVSVGVLDSPSGGGLTEIIGVLLAGAIWGAVLGWLSWRGTGQTTDGVAERS